MSVVVCGHWRFRRILYLHSNQLTGSIPGGLSSLSSLRHVWLCACLNELGGGLKPGLRVDSVAVCVWLCGQHSVPVHEQADGDDPC